MQYMSLLVHDAFVVSWNLVDNLRKVYIKCNYFKLYTWFVRQVARKYILKLSVGYRYAAVNYSAFPVVVCCFRSLILQAENARDRDEVYWL